MHYVSQLHILQLYNCDAWFNLNPQWLNLIFKDKLHERESTIKRHSVGHLASKHAIGGEC
jgi:fumarate reductase subunit C